MFRFRFILILRSLLIPFLLLPSFTHAQENTLKVAISTSVHNSGLFPYLFDKFNVDNKYKIDLQIVGSGKALRLGRLGAVDLVWVHSPKAEQKFIKDGHALKHKTVMQNNFVIIGPTDDPNKIASSNNVIDALQKIYAEKVLFISRGDDSGTHKKELELWKNAHVNPIGEDWYIETGVGMAKTLNIAYTDNGYALTDRATFIVHGQPSHKIIMKDKHNLFNPYSILLVKNTKQTSLNKNTAAKAFFEWVSSNPGNSAIADYKYSGQYLFKTEPLLDQ